jgi:hypothetical protein
LSNLWKDVFAIFFNAREGRSKREKEREKERKRKRERELQVFSAGPLIGYVES